MKIYLFLLILSCLMPNYSLAGPTVEDLNKAALRQEVSSQLYHIINFAWTSPNRFFYELKDKIFSRLDFIVGLIEKDPRYMTALKELGSAPSRSQPHGVPIQLSREIQSPNFNLEAFDFLRAYRKLLNASSNPSSWFSMEKLSELRDNNSNVRGITNQLAVLYLEDHGDNSVSSDLYDNILKLATTNPERLPEILKLYSAINSRVSAAKVLNDWLERPSDGSIRENLTICNVLLGK